MTDGQRGVPEKRPPQETTPIEVGTDAADKIAQLAALSRQVEAQENVWSLAVADRDAAEVLLLDRVVQVVRPSLPMICSEVRIATRSTMRERGKPDQENTVASFRGIQVAGTGPVTDDTTLRSKRGGWKGWTLILTDDGHWRRLDWSGHWSMIAGETSESRAAISTPSTNAVTEAVDPLDVMRSLALALAKQLNGRKDERSAEVRAEAERIRLAITILGAAS